VTETTQNAIDYSDLLKHTVEGENKIDSVGVLHFYSDLNLIRTKKL